MRKIVFAEHLTFPDSVQDLQTFRDWVKADVFPEKARASYLDGEFWVDLPMERAAHNLCKTAITTVLCAIVDATSGTKFSDGMLLSNISVGLSTQPDFMYIAEGSMEAGVATLLRGDDSLEVVGSPDMTLEVVSPTSVDKDTVQLRRLYWEAGVKEYWLVDSRPASFSFDILRTGPSKFMATRKQQGWIKSRVFGREFRLTKTMTKLGISSFKLHVR